MRRAASRAFPAGRFTVPQSCRLYRRWCLSRCVNPLPIQPFQQGRELCSRQPHHAVVHVRPAELAILKPLGEQAHAGAIPVNQLDPVSPFRPEDIDRTRERVGLHGLAYKRRQTLGSLAEVHRRRRHQHSNRARRTDHVPAFRARSTAATILASAPWPIRTLTPSISTSMLPELRVRWRGRPRDGRAGNAGSTTAGTNFGASAAIATGRRACRRQVNTCCGVSPFRRATSETTAPGTSVSSTIPALKSSENRRRRPVPVITSSRRTAVVSGLSIWSSVGISRSPIQRPNNRPSPTSNEGGITTALTLSPSAGTQVRPARY